MPSQPGRSATVLFLTDLHLDRAEKDEIDVLLHRLRNTRAESVILTGDISDARNICDTSAC